MTDDDPQQDLGRFVHGAVEEIVAYATTTQRILGALKHLPVVSNELLAIQKDEPFLGPEMHAAITAIREAGDALDRAHTALSARFDTRWGTDKTKGET